MPVPCRPRDSLKLAAPRMWLRLHTPNKRYPLLSRYRMGGTAAWSEKRGLNFHLRPKFSPFNSRLGDAVADALQSGRQPYSSRI